MAIHPKQRNQIHAQRLRQLREEMGLTQTDLARRIYASQGGLHQTAISQVESGVKGFKPETLGEVADVLGTSTDYLLGRTDDPTPYSDVEDQVVLVEKDPTRRELLQRIFSAIQRLPDQQRDEYINTIVLLYSGVVARANSLFRLDAPPPSR